MPAEMVLGWDMGTGKPWLWCGSISHCHCRTRLPLPVMIPPTGAQGAVGVPRVPCGGRLPGSAGAQAGREAAGLPTQQCLARARGATSHSGPSRDVPSSSSSVAQPDTRPSLAIPGGHCPAQLLQPPALQPGPVAIVASSPSTLAGHHLTGHSRAMGGRASRAATSSSSRTSPPCWQSSTAQPPGSPGRS